MILIPAYEPKVVLLTLIERLQRLIADAAFDCPIVVINDGSRSKTAQEFFREAKKRNILILEHETNQGKGAALKTGIAYARSCNRQWLVTADADGQHLPEDIIKVISKGIEWKNKVVLGVRSFDKHTPFRSRFGNYLTKTLFRLFHGGNIQDTQTGLRYIPNGYFEYLSNIPYNHYEFEFASLIQAVKEKNIRQIPIQTIYEPGNPTSHFRKFVDSARIYWVLARSILVSISSTILDISIFLFFQQFIESTLISLLISRAIATIFYFFLARSFVFKSTDKISRQFLQYSSLVFINALILSPIIDYIYIHTELPKGISYIFLTFILYLINISIQRWIIFRYKQNILE